MGDKNLKELLNWGIENSAKKPSDRATDPSAPPADSTDSSNDTTAAAAAATLNPAQTDALAQLMGMAGPSDADLMKASMAAITSSDPEMTLEAKTTAFDNLEQLIQSLDNANLLAKLGLWTPLLECLGHEEADLRFMACWCVGTAVQNNQPCQERLVALGGVERLVRMALGERETMEKRAGDGDVTTEDGVAPLKGHGVETKEVRRKAIRALSSVVRNYQPAMDVCAAELRRKGEPVADAVDAADMDAVDAVINPLRTKAGQNVTTGGS
ncbi:Uu.00g092060.m01.CDS01 [Anthostomella pinea]|uniref:Uu.00g092060.m01.CDS01 n=1 Tax=Anthostomella pinea TaxID=933095 RepID=A0AAI8VPD7_9PEZI|nr:Uu.00g092060.m01.CDS01 [Anthostomella pinea]